MVGYIVTMVYAIEPYDTLLGAQWYNGKTLYDKGVCDRTVRHIAGYSVLQW